MNFKRSLVLYSLLQVFSLLLAVYFVIFFINDTRLTPIEEFRAEKLIGSHEIYFENLTKQSPNQRYVAYVTASNLGMRDSNIWVYDKLTKVKYKAASGVGEFTWVTSPVWSPDSEKLSYFQVNPYEVRTVNLDGTNNRLISNDPKIYPSIGYGGEIKMIWSRENRINIENSVEFKKKMIQIKIDNYQLTQLAYINSVAGITNTGKTIPPLISQKDDKWKNIQLGSCTHQTIDSAGCVIASISMLLNYYDIDATPEMLNEMFSENDLGYANGCDVRWDVVMNYHKGIKLDTIFHYNRSWERLNLELDAGHPVILGMDKHNHWVLATHRIGNTYYINDPRGEKDGKKTLAEYGGTFDHMVIYTRSL